MQEAHTAKRHCDIAATREEVFHGIGTLALFHDSAGTCEARRRQAL